MHKDYIPLFYIGFSTITKSYTVNKILNKILDPLLTQDFLAGLNLNFKLIRMSSINVIYLILIFRAIAFFKMTKSYNACK